jgi:16S rRNA (guanine(966)-N(2))-methyltransferase RsmD
VRIIAGALRGRRLTAPQGMATRPTGEKVRGAVFNVLGQFFDGGAVLDLFAGSGALALEALSRGCATAVCVDADRRAAEAVRRNAEACGVADRVAVRCEPVEAALGHLPAGGFRLAFVDAPYAVGPEGALARLGALLSEGGVCVAEHDARRPPAGAWPGLALAERRRYGGTGISIYRRV